MNMFVIDKAVLTMSNGQVVAVPVREKVDCFVPDFGNLADGHRLVVVDGRMYRDVSGVVFLDKDGRRMDALKSEHAPAPKLLTLDPDQRVTGDYAVFKDASGARYQIDGMTLAMAVHKG